MRKGFLVFIIGVVIAGGVLLQGSIREPLLKEKPRLEEAKVSLEEKPELEIVEEKPIIFNSQDLRQKSNVTLDELNKAFDKVGQPQMKELSLAIIDAENFYNVNAFFLAGLIAEESGWTKYPAGGGSNLTGYAVYTSTSSGTSFSSRYDNIIHTAKLISEEYLNHAGDHHNGISIESVNIKYCLDENGNTKTSWARNINSIANMLRRQV